MVYVRGSALGRAANPLVAAVCRTGRSRSPKKVLLATTKFESRLPMLDHEEAIQQFECERGHRKEVECDDHLTMVGQKGEPALARIAATLQASQISRDRALGDCEAELQQFAMDLRRAPVRILSRHAVDEAPNLITDSGPPASWLGSPTPVPAKTGPMPADHSFRLHNK